MTTPTPSFRSREEYERWKASRATAPASPPVAARAHTPQARLELADWALIALAGIVGTPLAMLAPEFFLVALGLAIIPAAIAASKGPALLPLVGLRVRALSRRARPCP